MTTTTRPPGPILGIESSCDETAAAVVTGDGEVASNVISSQIPIHARFGGVIPELASRNHLMAVTGVVAKALADAGLTPDQLGAVAATRGPGLMGALMVGLQFAKGLALAASLDLVPVHHVEGHITAILLRSGGEHPHGQLEFPYVALAVSGGHTSLYLVRCPGSYRLLGVTVDDAAGEAFDKVARLLGLPYPGGVEIDRLARRGDPAAIKFPRPLPGRDNLDFSFSGLKTAVKLCLERHEGEADQSFLADVAAGFQEAAVDVLLRKTFAAARLNGVRHVVLSGGVAANSRLRARAVARGGAEGLMVHLTRLAYCTDNAAMIAGAARFGVAADRRAWLRLEPFASGQLADSVDAPGGA